MAGPESHMDGQERIELYEFVQAYNTAPNPGAQISVWRENFVAAAIDPKDVPLVQFVRRVGRAKHPRPAPPPIPPADQSIKEQIVAPQSADVVREQRAVMAVTDACSAAIAVEKPMDAFLGLKNIPEFDGTTINYVFRNIGGHNYTGAVMTVADAVESWYLGMMAPVPPAMTPGFNVNPTLPTGEPNPKYGMPTRNWDEVVASGRQDFINRFTGGNPAFLPNAEYLYNVGVKMILATNEQSKWGLFAASAGAKIWTKDVGRLDLQIKGSSDPNVSRFVRQMSNMLPVVSEGYLSKNVLPNSLFGLNVDQFVGAVNAGGVGLTAAALRVKDFSAVDVKGLAEYYGPGPSGALLSVNASLLENKFLTLFATRPDMALDALVEKKPENFLAGVEPGMRDGVVGALIEIAVGWNRKSGPVGKTIAAQEGKKDLKTGWEIGHVPDDGIKKFIGQYHRWDMLFDERTRKSYVDQLNSRFQGVQGRLFLPWTVAKSLVQIGGGGLSGGAEKSGMKKGGK